MDDTQKILDMARADVEGRRVARDDSRQQSWLWAFSGLVLTILLGIFFLPIRGIDYRLQMIVHGVCAQAHYLYLGDIPLPLCARNSGIYSGFLGSLLFLFGIGRGRAAKLPPLAISIVLVLGALSMVADGFNSLLLDVGGYNLYTPHNELRVVTGLLAGAAIGVFMVLIFNLALRKHPNAEQRILGKPIEFIALLLVNAVLYILLFAGPAFLYYPMALFSVFGIIGVLFIVNLFVVSMVKGLEGRVVSYRQLLQPATYAIVMTGAELILLSGLRIWVEGMAGMPM